MEGLITLINQHHTHHHSDDDEGGRDKPHLLINRCTIIEDQRQGQDHIIMDYYLVQRVV